MSSVTQGLRPAKFHEKVGALHLKPTFWQILGRHMFSMSYTGFSTLSRSSRMKVIVVLRGMSDNERATGRLPARLSAGAAIERHLRIVATEGYGRRGSFAAQK